MMLRIMLFPQLSGNSPMKSMVMIFHGHLGISVGTSSPIGCLWAGWTPVYVCSYIMGQAFPIVIPRD